MNARPNCVFGMTEDASPAPQLSEGPSNIDRWDKAFAQQGWMGSRDIVYRYSRCHIPS